MIDKERLASLRVAIASGDAGGGVDQSPLAGVPPEELRALRAEIDRILPPEGVGGLNIEHELVSLFRETKLLLQTIKTDSDTPVNQKAQVANSMAGTLGQLVKLQEDLRREETLKLMESCLIDSLKALPDEARDGFFAEYEKQAKKAGLM